jgi:Zn-dependent protease with chaperone function
LTRDPDALSRALQRLCQDNTAIAGASWASHLFVMNPRGDTSLGGFAPTVEQRQKAIEVWQATQVTHVAPGSTPAGAPIVSIDDYARRRKEMMTMVRAAMTGDAAAAARLQAIAAAMNNRSESGLHDMPDLNDIMLAQRGDRQAVARLRMMRHARDHSEEKRPGQTGLQAQSFISFHPPLKRRAKRLTRMGAHQVATARGGGPVIKALMALVYVVAVPAFAFVAAMMLFLITIVIIFNLALLTLWLTVIHILLTQDWAANYYAFMRFVDDVSRAIANTRR